jgi:hypothetical protein
MDMRACFISAKEGARRRNIQWNLTFGQFQDIWAPHWERKLDERLVMSRFWDRGAYEVGNVEIATSKQNNREAYLVRTLVSRRQITSEIEAIRL